ncbi:MAG TPA: hypothetical protein VMM92_00215 [Thermoanaerobaculia bacterium]|nr:hypothetical protein [Thermoanaerobaculia bacterium]
MSENSTPSLSPQPKKKNKQRALADLFREWEAMIQAYDANAADLAPISAHRAALADSLEKAKAAKGLQDAYRGNRQATTQKLKGIVLEGQDRAIRMRRAVGAQLGPGTEQLVQFGIRPLRRRGLPRSTEPTPAPAPQPTAALAPGAAPGKETA